MAYQKYQGYQYETSPRKLQPEYEPIKNPYKKKKASTKKAKSNTKNKVNQKMQIKAKVVVYVAIGFMILFAISYRNSLITESFNQKEQLKKDLSAIEKENEQLKVNIEKSLNLNNVEQSAKEMLGMKKLDNSQKIYISLPKKDHIESAAEEIIIEENTNIFEKIVKAFTNIGK